MVSGRFAYESFRLLSVRLRLESVDAYVLNSVLLLCQKISKTQT